MRTRYRPEIPDPASFVRSATIVPDANVLLGLYRLSPSTREDALSALEAVGSRLWMPHQVGLEFYRNLDAVRDDLSGAYAKARRAVEQASTAWKAFGEGRRYQESRAGMKALLESSVTALLDQIDALHSADRAIVVPENDQVLSRIEALFDGRVGPEPDAGLVQQRVEHFIAYRAPNEIPPGFEDVQRKPRPLIAAGDYLLWCEVLDFAEQHSGSVLLLTDDTKRDWYQRAEGKSEGPRKELITEFARRSGGAYHQTTLARFVELAQKVLHTNVAKDTVKEIAKIEQDSARESRVETALEQALGGWKWATEFKQVFGTEAALQIVSKALEDQTKGISDAFRTSLLANMVWPTVNLQTINWAAHLLDPNGAHTSSHTPSGDEESSPRPGSPDGEPPIDPDTAFGPDDDRPEGTDPSLP